MASRTPDARNPLPACDGIPQGLTEALRGILPTTSGPQSMPSSVAPKGPIATVVDEIRRQYLLRHDSGLVEVFTATPEYRDDGVTLTEIRDRQWITPEAREARP